MVVRQGEIYWLNFGEPSGSEPGYLHPYLSLYLKRHRAEYYDRLTAIREQGDWEGWLKFFLRGVGDTAERRRGRPGRSSGCASSTARPARCAAWA